MGLVLSHILFLSSPYKIYFAILFAIIFVLFFGISMVINAYKKNKQNKLLKKELLNYGKVLIDIDKIEVLDSSYYEESKRHYGTIYSALGSAFISNIESNKVENIRISYVNDGKKYISSPIPKSKEWLKMAMMTKHDIYLYYNHSEKKSYFFDISNFFGKLPLTVLV